MGKFLMRIAGALSAGDLSEMPRPVRYGLRAVFILIALAGLAGCATATGEGVQTQTAATRSEPAGSDLDRLIEHYARAYDVPSELVRQVIERESGGNPGAYNAGNWGLMQIRHDTARTMGYRGEAKGLLDAETNLRYAVKYLRGAYLVADGDSDRAVSLYASGYYYHAKRKGLLEETGLRPN